MHSLSQVLKHLFEEIGNIKNAYGESISERDSKKNPPRHTSPFSSGVDFEDEEEEEDDMQTANLYWDMLSGSEFDNEDEVIE